MTHRKTSLKSQILTIWGIWCYINLKNTFIDEIMLILVPWFRNFITHITLVMALTSTFPNLILLVGDCQVWEKYYLNLELNWSILVNNLKNCINVNVGDVRDFSKINIHFTNIGTNRLLSNRKPEIKEIIFLASIL